jgi:serine protease Do
MFNKKRTALSTNPILFLLAVIASITGVNAQTPNSAAQLSDSFAEVAKKVEPAVVSIDTKGKAPEATARGNSAPANPEEILDFLRRQSRRPTQSVGSGFIVERSGYILTNAHVVQDSAKITVRLDNGDEFPAKVIGVDDETDIAVLKIEAGRDLPVVNLGDSNAARVGEWVLAIGSPFGLARTVTAGIVSQTNRDTPMTTVFQRFIQTDAAINRGNSGGPLVNMRGEVIGVNSQIATSTGDYNGVGFALPSNEAKYVLDQIVKNGRVKRGFLGVALESVKSEFAKVYGLPEAKGAIVTDVRDPGSGAALAGLRAGDVITTFKGQPISNAQDLIAKVALTPPNESVGLEFLRESGTSFERRTANVRLGERPVAKRASTDDPEPVKLPLDAKNEETRPFGLTLGDLTPTLAATYKLEGQKGVLVKEINPNSFIADVKSSNGIGAALGTGDLIQRINRISITDSKAFTEAVKKLQKGDAVVLHVLTYDPERERPALKVVQFTVQ